MAWAILAGAILTEVSGTLSLRMAVHGSRLWYGTVIAGYTISILLLAVVLDLGLNLGVAYGVWAASGVALTAIASRIFFGEPITRLMAGGLLLIVAGVLLVELGAVHA